MSHAKQQGPGQEASHLQAREGEEEGKGLGEGRGCSSIHDSKKNIVTTNTLSGLYSSNRSAFCSF
jgi:hypothetical protein